MNLVIAKRSTHRDKKPQGHIDPLQIPYYYLKLALVVWKFKVINPGK